MDTEKDTEYIALEELWNMSPKKRLTYLIKKWDLIDGYVYGQIQRIGGATIYTLRDVKNINGIPLEYPIAKNEIRKIQKTVSDFGIFAGHPNSILCDRLMGQLVKAQIEINSPQECEKSSNPLSVKINSPELVTFIPSGFIKKDVNGNVLIEESVKQFIIKKKSEEIDEKLLQAKNRLENSEHKLIKIDEKILSQNEVLQTVRDKISDGNEKIAQFEKDIFEQKKNFYKIRNECETEKKKEIERLKIVKKEVNLKMTQLKEYVHTKADFLYDLKLISKEQFDYVTGNTEKKSNRDESRLDFANDLDGDFNRLISQIQAYLYSSKKTYYTKSVLENFLTLLRTNDLIIISGASGTGKSYLVKAFAQAIGGVAKIVPVKPNWTSSEDLLGYYNPMQKSYMTTPFLDAIVGARRDPEHLHLICLDEMNLARVEYYFADFLSVLEEREITPTISLYSIEEAEHIRSEFETIIGIFDEARSSLPDEKFSSFGDFLTHRKIAQKLNNIFGNNEKHSLVELYGKIRRMIGGVLNIPAEFEFPSNVRIIGTINIDQTTHYFAPKVLDRSYLMKLESPLKNISLVEDEVGEIEEEPPPVYLSPSDFWLSRTRYPLYTSNNIIAKRIEEWNKEFLSPMGIEVGMRVMRQALLFQELYKDLQGERSENLFDSDTINIILLMKIFPHFMFDGDLNSIMGNNEVKKHDLVKKFSAEINKVISPTIEGHDSNNAFTEIKQMIQRAELNEKVYNYWT